MSRIVISLTPSESDALLQMAEREYRHPRDQAALIIRNELERAGLLPVDASATMTLPAQPSQPEASQ